MISLPVKELTRLEASLGLIGKKIPEPVLLKTRFGIHTFFMNFPIDVVILDNNRNVAKLKENIRPNSIFLWNPRHNLVLELPPGIIGKEKIKIGDKINLVISAR